MSLAVALANAKGVLAARVTDEMYEDPFWVERFAARGRKHSEQDLGFHVDYLVQAVVANDPGVMEHYARWLQELLTTRGMCTIHVDDSFERLERAALDHVPGAAAISPHIAAARAALFYEDGSARELQDAAGVLGKGGIGIEGPAYHLAYLADAIALGQPRAFSSHIEWLAGYCRRRHGSSNALEAGLTALRGAVDGHLVLGVTTRTVACAILDDALAACAQSRR